MHSWSHGDGDDVESPGRPVIDGGSRGAVGVATQVAGSSCVDVAEADTYARPQLALCGYANRRRFPNPNLTVNLT